MTPALSAWSGGQLHLVSVLNCRSVQPVGLALKGTLPLPQSIHCLHVLPQALHGIAAAFADYSLGVKPSSPRSFLKDVVWHHHPPVGIYSPRTWHVHTACAAYRPAGLVHG